MDKRSYGHQQHRSNAAPGGMAGGGHTLHAGPRGSHRPPLPATSQQQLQQQQQQTLQHADNNKRNYKLMADPILANGAAKIYRFVPYYNCYISPLGL